MTDWMYAHNLPIDMHPEGCECGCRTLTYQEYIESLQGAVLYQPIPNPVTLFIDVDTGLVSNESDGDE